MNKYLSFIAGVAAMALATALAAPVSAEGYPSKPVRIIVPYGAGGSTDMAARSLASVIHEFLGQPVVVFNKAGGGGTVGAVAGVRADPDGYTLTEGAIGAHVMAPAVNKSAGYSPDDYTPIAMTQMNPNVFVVNADSPYKTIEEVIAAIKANPGKLKQSNPGLGSIHNFGFNQLMKAAGVPHKDVISVPFKGSAEAVAALLGGHVDFHQTNLTGVLDLIEGGRLRALATTSKERLDELPDVPTYAELGYPSVDIFGWRGIVGPKGLPQEVVDKWVDAIKETQASKPWQKMTKSTGDVPTFMGPDEFGAFMDKSYKEYRAMAEELKILVE